MLTLCDCVRLSGHSMQFVKNDFSRHFISRRVRFRFRKKMHAIFSQQLHTFCKGRVSIESSPLTNHRNGENWLSQSGIFTEQTQGECVTDPKCPFIQGVKAGPVDDKSIGFGQDIRVFRALLLTAHRIACLLNELRYAG